MVIIGNVLIGVFLGISGDQGGIVMLFGFVKMFKEVKEEWVLIFECDYIFNLLRCNNANIFYVVKEVEIDCKYFCKFMKKYELDVVEIKK